MAFLLFLCFIFTVGNAAKTDYEKSYLQLTQYFPNEIDCDRVFDEDSDYIKNITVDRPKLDSDSLDMSCEAIRQRFSTAPSFNEDYSIAYAKIVYRDYQFLEQQMWNSYTDKNWYCFIVDAKASDEFHEKFQQLSDCLPNVLLSKVNRSVGSDGTNQNYAHLDCMIELQSKPYKYVFLLQNHDILTRTHSEFATILQLLEGSTIVDKYKCPNSRCREEFPTNLKDLQLCPKSFHDQELSDCESANITYMKGSMQALFPKAAADFIVQEINVVHFIEMFSQYHGGDEQLFPSLTTTEALKVPGRYTATCGSPYHIRYAVWYNARKCGSGYTRHNLCIFGLEDLAVLKSVDHFLINKMLPAFDNGAVQCFSELLLKRNMGIEKKEENLEKYTNGDLARFQRESREPGFNTANFVCNKDKIHTTVTPN